MSCNQRRKLGRELRFFSGQSIQFGIVVALASIVLTLGHASAGRVQLVPKVSEPPKQLRAPAQKRAVQGRLNRVRIVAFNILAPTWANPSLYPATAAPHLDRVSRIKLIVKFLEGVASKVDIFALQETSDEEFKKIAEALGSQFHVFQVFHDSKYWTDWNSDLAREPNGVGLLVKKSSFDDVQFKDFPLFTAGNHSAQFEGVHRATGNRVRATSIHLEPEKSILRSREFVSLLGSLGRTKDVTDLIAGDFNFGIQSGTLRQRMVRYDYVDVLASVGSEAWTIPYKEGWYGTKANGVIDHIIVRNATPAKGKVFDFNLWNKYPSSDAERMVAGLQIFGSDHFPVFGEVKLRKLRLSPESKVHH